MQHPRYQILGRIDTGGMAEVFRAMAESTVAGMKRQVAIKRILPELTHNQKFVAMFLDEARLSLRLQHANIVQVTDIGKSESPTDQHGSSFFLVMEYVDGFNLKTLLDHQRQHRKPWPISYSLYIAMEICKALAYAHALADPDTGRPLGIVHRDVSPANILVSKQGEVKLTDFGLAKAASQLQGTEPGIVKGKFSYLSPEAAAGKEVDARADLFSLGSVLFEMLTNQRLFEGNNDLQTIQQVQQAAIPHSVLREQGVDEELRSILQRTLAPDPQERYQSASGLLDDLASYLFKHGLKVTSHDMESMVSGYIKQKTSTSTVRLDELTDALVQEEILRFSSLEDLDSPPPFQPRQQPSETALLEDPRGWGAATANKKSAPPPPPIPSQMSKKTGTAPSVSAPPKEPPPVKTADKTSSLAPTPTVPVDETKQAEKQPRRVLFFLLLFGLFAVLVAFLLIHPDVQKKLCASLEVFCGTQ